MGWFDDGPRDWFVAELRRSDGGYGSVECSAVGVEDGAPPEGGEGDGLNRWVKWNDGVSQEWREVTPFVEQLLWGFKPPAVSRAMRPPGPAPAVGESYGGEQELGWGAFAGTRPGFNVWSSDKGPEYGEDTAAVALSSSEDTMTAAETVGDGLGVSDGKAPAVVLAGADVSGAGL